jgi:hypothetical protein
MTRGTSTCEWTHRLLSRSAMCGEYSDGPPASLIVNVAHRSPCTTRVRQAPRDAFWLHAADFQPSSEGHVELCLVEQDYGLPDDHPVSDIWNRLIEGDYTIAGYITPRERGPAGKVARRACFLTPGGTAPGRNALTLQERTVRASDRARLGRNDSRQRPNDTDHTIHRIMRGGT